MLQYILHRENNTWLSDKGYNNELGVHLEDTGENYAGINQPVTQDR